MGAYPSGFPPEIIKDVSPDRGEGAAFLRQYVLHLDTARVDERFTLGGIFLWAFDTVGVSAEVGIKYNAPTGDEIPFKRGTKISGVPFQELYISHTAQPGSRMRLVASNRNLDVENSIGLSSLVEVAPPTLMSADQATITGTSGSANLVLGANANRRSAIFLADDGNTEAITITDAATGTLGIPLQAGDSLSLEHTSAVYAFRPSANQTLHILTELS